MKTVFNRKGAQLAGVLAVSLWAVSTRAAAEGSFDRILKVTGSAEVEVNTGSGSISVRRGDSGSVRVHGLIRISNGWQGSGEGAESKIRALQANPPIEQNGNTIRIGRIEDPQLRRGVSISYDLEVPSETRLTSTAGSGSLTVRGIRGPLKARTGSGSLKVSEITDETRLETGSGDIELENIQGGLSAQTGTGSIRAVSLGSSVMATTGSGSIRLQQSGPGAVKLETGSGSVEASGVKSGLRAHTGSGNIQVEGTPGGDWNLETGSGNLILRLPPNTGFMLNAHTGSGQINTDHPITVQGSVGRNNLHGKVGNGGAMLNLETGSGNIRIE
jgi:DUF4097 and DUF4098 domain-containing protein YvlB